MLYWPGETDEKGGGEEKNLSHSPSTTPTSPDKNTFSFPGFLFFVTKKSEPVNEVDYKTTLRLGTLKWAFPATTTGCS